MSSTHDLDFGLSEVDSKATNFDLDDNFFGPSGEEKQLSSKDFRTDLSDNEMINPFFVNINGSVLGKMNRKDIFGKYKRVFVLCHKDSATIETKCLLQRVIDKTVFKNAINSLTLLSVDSSILKNRVHMQQAVIINKTVFSHLESDKFDFDTNEVVIPLFELKENVAKLYIKLYSNDVTIEHVVATKILMQYFGCSSTENMIHKLSDMIQKSRDVQYWQNPNNCKMNMTDAFKSRMFRYKETIDGEKARSDTVTLKDPEAKQMVDKLMTSKYKQDYDILDREDPFYKPEKYTDLASGLKQENGYRLYRIDTYRRTSSN